MAAPTTARFGKFRVVHPGDLTWNKEGDLMCPNNRLGTADLLIVGHHGQPVSNSEVMVHALRPRVSIVNIGTRKGGQPDPMKVVLNSPGHVAFVDSLPTTATNKVQKAKLADFALNAADSFDLRERKKKTAAKSV